MLAVYSDSCKYAIRALVHIARLEPAERASVQEILAEGEYPEASLAKVLQRLAASGILVSAKGPGGGFRLARPAAAIHLSDVVHAVDGQARVQECALGFSVCSESSWCPIHEHWYKAKVALGEMLRTKTIADLLRRAPARSRSRQPEPVRSGRRRTSRGAVSSAARGRRP